MVRVWYSHEPSSNSFPGQRFMASVLWMGCKSPEIVSTIYVYLGHVHSVITNREKKFFTDPLTLCIVERKINEGYLEKMDFDH